MTDTTSISAPSAPAPSEKALGKRPITEVDQSTTPSTSSAPAPQREKRVTRSTRGGHVNGDGQNGEGPDGGNSANSSDSGSASLIYLPINTPLLLTTRLLPRLNHYPPSTSTHTALETPIVQEEPKQKKEEKPLYRLMEETEFLPSRNSRHAPVAAVDTSDQLYQRLHRYPEVLEKRASRLERERLIHERSKLILELEELKGRGWVYQTNANGNSVSTSTGEGGEDVKLGKGGRAEEERQRKLREGEERLRKYDSLLPNQPRKSNFLNVSSSSTSLPSVSTLPTSTSLPNFRSLQGKSASPKPLSLNRSSSLSRRQSIPISSARPFSTTTQRSARRDPTPLSASSSTSLTNGGNSSGLKITIKFNPSPVPQSSSSKKDGKPDKNGSSNARKSEWSYHDKKRGGDKKLSEVKGRELPGRSSRLKNQISYAEDDDDEGGESDLDGEILEQVGVAVKEEENFGSDSSLSELEDDDHERERSKSRSVQALPPPPKPKSRRLSSTNLPNRRISNPPIPATTTSLHSGKPHRPKRLRLKNSFFHMASQRDTFFPSSVPLPKLPLKGSNKSQTHFKPPSDSTSSSNNRRRSSSRVVYAFGHRLPPDSVLLKQTEFEPHGGGYHSTTSYASSSSNSDNDSSSSETDSEIEREKAKEKASRGIDPETGRRNPKRGFSRKNLEDLVKDRLDQRGEGEDFVVFGGRILPRSAIFESVVDNTGLGGTSIGDAGKVSKVKEEEEEHRPIAKPPVAVHKRATSRSSRPSIQRPSEPVPAPPAVPSVSSIVPQKTTNTPRPSLSKPVSTSSKVSKPPAETSSTAGGVGGGLGFALPSVTQVLFASVPAVQSTEEEEDEDQMEVDEE